jgi:SOS response regulatory protein OraA/RecX
MKPQPDLMQTALKYLGRRFYSQRQLESKLTGVGFNAVEITAVFERLIGWGYLNDRQFGMERIRLLMERCKSRMYVIEDLNSCGLASILIDELIMSEYPTTLEVEIAIRFLRKRSTSRRNDPALVFQVLTRAGFGEDAIRRCLAALSPT